MKLVSRLSALVMALMLALSLIPAMAQEVSCETEVTVIEKYGNLDLAITGEEFFALGFAYGDTVKVTLNGTECVMPVGGNYSDVDTGSLVCRVPAADKNVIIAINMGDLATATGIAVKTTFEDKSFQWDYCEGVEVPVKVSIVLDEKEGYLSQYLLHQLTRTNERSDYAELTDKQFANFREINVGGIAPGTLYRSSSPINPEIARNICADTAAKEAGILTVMNLSDSPESAQSYEGFNESYYSGINVVYLNLGVDFTADSFKAGLAEGFTFLSNNKGPYLVHCNEGKDRAGFTSAMLECLMGATAEEVIADYMVTYFNYYGVEEGSEQYTAIAASNIAKSLAAAFEVADITADDVDLAKEAEEYCLSIGMTQESIDALKANLAGATTLESTDIVGRGACTLI